MKKTRYYNKSLFLPILLTFLTGLLIGTLVNHIFSYAFKNEIHIVFLTDDNYAPHTVASISSILDNAAESDNLHFHVVLNNASDETKQKLLAIKSTKKFLINIMDLKKIIPPHTPNWMINVVNARMLLPDLFPTLDKILYADSDIIVLKSLSPFYHLMLSDVYAAVVSDTEWSRVYRTKELGLSKYFNAGVMLLNLKKMREDHLVEKFIKARKKLRAENKIIWEDQDVMNFVFDENVIFLPQRFNLLAHDIANFSPREVLNPVIIHYTSCKPWEKPTCHFSDYYKKYMSESELHNNLSNKNELAD